MALPDPIVAEFPKISAAAKRWHWWMYLPYVYADRPAVRAYGGAALQSSPNYVFLRSADLFRDHAIWGRAT